MNGVGSVEDEDTHTVVFADNNVRSLALDVTNSNVQVNLQGLDLTRFKTMTVAATGENIVDTNDHENTVETLTVTGTGSVDFAGWAWDALKTFDALRTLVV